MRIVGLAIGFALLCLPISSTSLTIVEELQEILQTWELGSTISREGLAESRAEVTGLKAELTAYELTEKGLQEESRGLKADSTKLRLDLISVTGQKDSLQISFDDYKVRVKREVAKELRVQKIKTVIWCIVVGVLGVAAGLGLSVIF